jgi:hypothetical protein
MQTTGEKAKQSFTVAITSSINWSGSTTSQPPASTSTIFLPKEGNHKKEK